MGVARGVAERELREAGRSLMILLSLDIVVPRPGPLLGGEATLEGGEGADNEDSGLGGGVGARPSLWARPGPPGGPRPRPGRGGRLTGARWGVAELEEEGVAELTRPSLSIFSSGGDTTTRDPVSRTYNVLNFSRRGVMCAVCYFNQVSFLLLILTLLLSKHHFNIVQITFVPSHYSSSKR